jgi:hypothetical protein
MTRDYYTYRIRINNRQRVQAEMRDLEDHLKGEPEGRLTYDDACQAQVQALHQAAQAGQIDGSQIKTLGEKLFGALFDERLRHDFFGLYEAARKEGALVRVELDVDERALPDLAALPWEFMRVPTDSGYGTLWLGTAPDVIFSRRRTHWIAPEPIQLEQDEPLRIALAVAAPDEQGLGVVKYQKVWKALQKLAEKMPDRIRLLDLINPATPAAIDDVLEQKPHIFQFIGHAQLAQDAQQRDKGRIALANEFSDEPLWFDGEQFSELFTRYRPGVVLLQSCESAATSAVQAFVGVASRVVEQNIPVVVAMQYRVSNSTAARFALEFYERLAQGDPVDKAAQEGRRRIALGPAGYGKRDFATPVLFMRVRDGHLFDMPEAKAGQGAVETPAVSAVPFDPHKPVSLPDLARDISAHFGDEDLRFLCLDVGADYENLPGAGKSAKARELVLYCNRRGLIPRLRKKCHELRSHVEW